MEEVTISAKQYMALVNCKDMLKRVFNSGFFEKDIEIEAEIRRAIKESNEAASQR
jgi:hypothetical protein